MFRLLFFSVILVTGHLACLSQIPENFPSVDKKDLPGVRISSYRAFNGSSLFGYINGGAELYLEYGFIASSVSEIEFAGGKYKTEIYKMNDAEAAFGIFSVSKFRCRILPDLSEFTCQTKYQLQICKGPYYISIINRTGTSSDSINSINIGKVIADKIKEDNIDLSSFIPDIPTESIKSNWILVKGRLGFMNGSPELEDYFKEIEDYTALILRGDQKTILSVKFANSESLKKFLTLHNWEDEKISIVGLRGSSGEMVNKISDNHLFIEIPE